VPIYPHQIFDKKDWPLPPNQAVQAYKPEAEWPLMDINYEFVWSIHSMSLIEVIKPDGVILFGYFRGLDRSTGAIGISNDRSKDTVTKGIGARTLLNFRRLVVDRLGETSEVKREVRTWHGAACI
jgi:CRISPR-associated endonuclease Csn1